MSDEKAAKLGQQLPTSEQLQAAIGPELRALARQALEQKGEEPPSLADILEPPSKRPGEVAKKEAIVQKTVPLAFPVAKEIFAQAAAQAQQAVVPGVAVPAPAPKVVAAPASARSAPATSSSTKKAEEAKRDAPTAKVARKRSSTPTLLLAITGIVAIGAAGGAVWQAKKMGTATPAQAATAAPSEGAVKFNIPARPADDPAPPADTTPPAEVKPADPAPPVTAAAADPTAKAVDPAAKPDPKTAEPKPVHHARIVPAAAPAPQAPVAAAEPKKTEDKKPAAQPTTAPSVDAILQQQLKSAIP
ncbi:MAG TPA: hypothetical protein VIF62_21535 [Labilithrix sp.]|jgi:hypothetical protein